MASNGDRRRDVRVGLVILEQEILGLVIEQPLPPVPDHQLRQRPRFARQLQPRLIEVVGIEMAIAAGPHEHARLKPALARGELQLVGATTIAAIYKDRWEIELFFESWTWCTPLDVM